MIKVTLRYMGCIKETFHFDSLSVSEHGRIQGHCYYKSGDSFAVDTGWTLDGNTSIETEPVGWTEHNEPSMGYSEITLDKG